MTRPDPVVNSPSASPAAPPLKRGTATKIAHRLGLSVQHVNEVIRGRRTEASAALLRAIQHERSKQARAAARELARRAARAEAGATGASRQKDALPRSA